MSKAPLLPDRIETLDEVTKRDRLLYRRDAAGDAYEITHIGRALARYRQAAAENPGGQVPPPRKMMRFDREGWSQLIAMAEPDARAYFLRCAASGTIKVQG
jgi:hypothetical protein